MTADLLDVPLPTLLAQARQIRDDAHGRRVTFSPKVFIPLTMLCRDKCGYCTFAQPPARLESPFLSPDEVLAIARAGAAAGCHEALFTLGERPELRYPIAAEWLAANGHASTIDYLVAMAKLVVDQTGLLPHANAGALFPEELAALRGVAPGQGMMLESLARRPRLPPRLSRTRRQSGASRRSRPRASSRSPSRPASSSASARPEPTASSRSRRSRRRIASTATCKR